MKSEAEIREKLKEISRTAFPNHDTDAGESWGWKEALEWVLSE